MQVRTVALKSAAALEQVSALVWGSVWAPELVWVWAWESVAEWGQALERVSALVWEPAWAPELVWAWAWESVAEWGWA